MIYFIISLVLVLVAVIFALSNSEAVEVQFLFWGYEGSLALILLLTFLLGMLTVLLSLIPGFFKKKSVKKEEEPNKEVEVKQTIDNASQ
ncbi:hypothetical protein CL654_03040 [bacterium]|nr:hypothetical protein [bacterium]|tara:strand:+ start:9177 stop:9443 length:267 start_codon:yes stop_codon:yes gene_type:complete